MEENVCANIKGLVLPYIKKIRGSRLRADQNTYVDILEKNLNSIVSDFSHSLSGGLYKLTPTELQVANLVKEGHSSKDIADLLFMAYRTVETHRNNIRKKLNIKNRKVNLRSYLLSH